MKEKKTPAGLELERQVAAHFEALGYQITPNAQIGGHQVDILAQKIIEAGTPLILMIEVKQRSSKAVGIEEVADFIVNARDLIGQSLITNAIMVTDGKYSQVARGRVSAVPAIKLLTLAQLEQDIFQYSESLLKIVDDYKHSEISRDYISLSGTMLDDDHVISDITLWALQWAKLKESLLIVVGDFGSGKTTILDRIRYEQARSRVRDQSELYPVLLKLRSFRQYPDLWSFVLAGLRDNQYINPSRETFIAQLEAGRLILLLDGFDEIHTGATARDRGNYLAALAPLLTSKSPCILSTRPTYFESFDELMSAFRKGVSSDPLSKKLKRKGVDLDKITTRLDFRREKRLSRQEMSKAVIIDQLNEQQVINYLTNYDEQLQAITGRSCYEILEFLYRIYDLEDLMRRPLLLNMVVETIIGGGVDITDDRAVLGPATLYDIYTHLCARREESRPFQFLTVEERLQTCRGLAMEMLALRRIELSAEEVRSAISKLPVVKLRSPTAETLESVISDVRVCSFLKFSENDALRFAHKSFYEFFVASAIYEEGLRGAEAIDRAAARDVEREVLYFLGSFVRDEEAFAKTILLALQKSDRLSAQAKSLLGRIALASGELLGKVSLVGGKIDRVDLRRASVSGAYFKEVQFSNVGLRHVRGQAWRLLGARADKLSISESSFDRCEVELLCTDFISDQVNWNKCRFKVEGGDWKLEASKFDECSISLGGKGFTQGVTIVGSQKVTFEPGFVLSGGSDLTFRNCTVIGAAEGKWRDPDSEVRFQNCALAGVWVDVSDILGMLNPDRRRNAYLSFANCEGVIFTHDWHNAISEVSRVELKKTNANLEIFNLSIISQKLIPPGKSGHPVLSKYVYGPEYQLDKLRAMVNGKSWRTDLEGTPLGSFIDGHSLIRK